MNVFRCSPLVVGRLPLRQPIVRFLPTRHSSSQSSSSVIDPSSDDDLSPYMAGRKLWRKTENPHQKTPQAWVTSMKTGEKKALIDLHPQVWRVAPRIDILTQNIRWQRLYKRVTYTKSLSRGELPGVNTKPWPQKKSGRAHHGSRKSPIFLRGGIVNGIRGPATDFYMLSMNARLVGMMTALTIKHAQDDLVIVDNLADVDLTQHREEKLSFELHEMAEARNWGYSVLFVDVEDTAPQSLAAACADIAEFNILPVYGLNCWSMLKHETLVMTVDAVLRVEEQLLKHWHRAKRDNKYRYVDHKDTILGQAGEEFDPDADEYPPFV